MMNASRSIVSADYQPFGHNISEALNERCPRATDDESQGYAEGDIWIAQGRCWRAARVTYPAIWLPDRATGLAQPSLPFDVAAGCVAAFGTIKLRAGYAGPALAIERDDGRPAEAIAFHGKEIDVAAADANGRAHNRVSAWFDQSGNAFHALSSGDNRPVLPPIPTIGMRRGVMFDSGLTVNVKPHLQPAQFLTLPSELSVSSRNVTVIVYAKLAHGWRPCPLVEFSSSRGKGSLGFCLTRSASAGGLALYSPGSKSLIYSGSRPSLEPSAYAARLGPDCVSFRRWGGDASPKGEALPDQMFGGGLIAGAFHAFAGGHDLPRASGSLGAVLIYDRALDQDEIDAVFASLYYHFEGTPQLRDNVVFDGDSITNGAYGTYYLSWPEQLRLQVARNAAFFNVAVGGGGLETQINHIPKWKHIYNPSFSMNALILNVGTNDLVRGMQATDMQEKMERYLEVVREEERDWNKIIVGTVLPRGQFNNHPETLGRQWHLWNDIVRAKANLWGVSVIDWTTDPTLGDPLVVNNRRLFGDPTHPTAEGLGYMAAISRDKLGFP